MEKFEKNFERISSHHWSDMSNVPYKVRIDRINIVRALLLLSMSKKLKKPWGQGWVETKLLALKHWLDKKIRQMKNHLKSKDFSLLWKLANKNVAIFFVCNRNRPSPPPQLSRFRSLHRLSSNNWENTNHKHLPLTGANHCNSRLSKNIQI